MGASVRLKPSQMRLLAKHGMTRVTADAIELSENDIERQVCDFMAAQGYVPIRNHVGKFVPLSKATHAISLAVHEEDIEVVKRQLNKSVITINQRGCPDWLFVHGTKRTIWVETKAPGEVPSEEQALEIKRLEVSGQLATWTDSIDRYIEWFQKVSQSA